MILDMTFSRIRFIVHGLKKGSSRCMEFSFRNNSRSASLYTEHSKTYGFADCCPTADYFLHTPRSDRPSRASPTPAEAEAGSPKGLFSHLIRPIPDLYW